MSSTNRTTSKGGKGAKADKSHKTDGGKGGGDKVHNKENTPKNEEISIKEKVKQLMDLTHRSEDEVCLALHENDNDITKAINFIYEENGVTEWETKDKKKKKRQTSTGKQDKKADEGNGGSTDDWDDGLPPPSAGNNIGSGDGKEWKERGGGGGGGRRDNKNGGPPRRWRDESGRGGDRRGGGRGLSRGGGVGRGRGGGRAGGRFPPRGNRMGNSGGGRDYNRQPIDTWDNSNTWDNSTAAAATNHTKSADDWDDFHTDEWSTEEYTGSLVETKVFTPSVQPILQENSLDSAGQTLNSLDQNLVGPTQQENTYSQSLGQAYNATVQQLPSQQSPVPPMVGTLTAAQTQYFSQLSQQNSDALGKQFTSTSYQAQQNAYDTKPNVQQVYNNASQAFAPSSQGYGSGSQQSYSNNPAQSYNSGAPQTYGNAAQPYGAQPAQSYGSQSYGTAQQNYGNSNSYRGSYQTGTTAYGPGQEVQQSQQPQRTKTQRARVPPPSKIPASAVEMPGDLNSSITYLDVQFGGMDLIDNSFDSNTGSDIKYGTENNRSATGLDNSRSTPTTALDLDSSTLQRSATSITGDTGYNSGSSASKNGTQSSISSALSQGLSNTENIPPTSDHLSYNNTGSSRTQGSNVTTSVPSVTTTSALDLNKQTSDAHSYNSQSVAYNSYQSKANTYNSTHYSATQTTASSYVNPSVPTYVNNQASSYAAGGGVQNSSATGSYAYQNATSYPSVTQVTNSYQSSGQGGYPSAQNPSSQSVYGANTGLSSNPNFTSATNQYNSYNSTGGGHKLSGNKENSYESNVTASATNTTSSNVAASNSTALSLSQATISNSKSTPTLAKNSTSVISNIPPGVPPVMSTPYIMGQVPYFQQPVYSYEEMQLLQQRLPHMTTPYYDMGYQTPTTLATVRDPTGAAALGAYGAATADARFQTAGRATDGTTSPVPAAAQQQQQQQQPPILAAAGTAPPYFFTAFNTIAAAPPNYPQFGAMYTQLPTVTNAHSSSASNQYGPKPTTYGSTGYGAYDALGQSAQDYAKGGYAVGTVAAAAAVQQAAQKGQANSTSAGSGANDLSAMYGKSHAALGKVNSYEKQGFHSGTPPPFTGALSQNAGLTPSATGYAPQVYIPTMPQHHSTMAMHQPLHQMDVRHQTRRADSGNSSNQRSQGSNQSKSGSKQSYTASYWNQN